MSKLKSSRRVEPRRTSLDGILEDKKQNKGDSDSDKSKILVNRCTAMQVDSQDVFEVIYPIPNSVDACLQSFVEIMRFFLT